MAGAVVREYRRMKITCQSALGDNGAFIKVDQSICSPVLSAIKIPPTLLLHYNWLTEMDYIGNIDIVIEIIRALHGNIDFVQDGVIT